MTQSRIIITWSRESGQIVGVAEAMNGPETIGIMEMAKSRFLAQMAGGVGRPASPETPPSFSVRNPGLQVRRADQDG